MSITPIIKIAKIYSHLKNILKLAKGYSAKFAKIAEMILKCPGTAFIYSNLVRAGGMDLFAESLRQNGYLEYEEDNKNYDLKDDTLDYKTGKTYLQFKKEKLTNYENKINELEKKNNELRKKIIVNYKDQGVSKWESFKKEFNHDMEELKASLKNLFKDNVKE